MQTPAFLCFELQVAQQCLPENFALSRAPRNLNSPSRVRAVPRRIRYTGTAASTLAYKTVKS